MRHLGVTILAIAFLLPAAPVLAQATETDVPQTFWVEIGGFRAGSNTNLRLSGGSEPGDDVDFERDLSLPSTTTQGYLEAFWRPGRRHQVSLNWTGIRRNGGRLTLDEEIHWGDEVFRVGADVEGTNDSDFLSGAYRFALIKNSKFEIGPSLGIGYLWVKATLAGEAGIGSGDDSAIREVEVESNISSITGDLGAYMYWWAGERWLIRADARYLFVTFESSEGSVTEARAGVAWYPWRQVGIGAQYSFTRFAYDRDELVTQLGGMLQYDGVQLFANVAF